MGLAGTATGRMGLDFTELDALSRSSWEVRDDMIESILKLLDFACAPWGSLGGEAP